MSGWGGMLLATCTSLALFVAGWPGAVTRGKVGRRAPDGAASRSVGAPTVAGTAAVSLIVVAWRFGPGMFPHGSTFGTLAVEGLRHIPVGQSLGLVLSGLTTPSLLIGV